VRDARVIVYHSVIDRRSCHCHLASTLDKRTVIASTIRQPPNTAYQSLVAWSVLLLDQGTLVLVEYVKFGQGAHLSARRGHSRTGCLELLQTRTSRILDPSDFSSQTTNDDLDHRPTTPPNTNKMAPKKGAKTADSINAKLALTIKVRTPADIFAPAKEQQN
jgi:hypothetical protein